MDLDSLNEWVGTTYPLRTEEIMVESKHQVIDIYLNDAPKSHEYEEYRDLIVDILSEYKAILNNGGGTNDRGRFRNDCLIISFLMGVSENYRKLSYKDRYKVSDIYRRNVLPKIIFSADKSELGLTSSNGKNTNEDVKRRVEKRVKNLEGYDFLFDNIIGLLSKIYKIFIITLEPGKRDVQGGEQKYQPPSIIENGLIINESIPLETGNKIPEVYDRGIVICNMDNNGHFEILTKDNKYLFNRPEILDFYRVINDNNPYKFKPLIENAAQEAANANKNLAATKIASLNDEIRREEENNLEKAIALSLEKPLSPPFNSNLFKGFRTPNSTNKSSPNTTPPSSINSNNNDYPNNFENNTPNSPNKNSPNTTPPSSNITPSSTKNNVPNTTPPSFNNTRKLFFRSNKEGLINPRIKPRNLTKFHPKKREQIQRIRNNRRRVRGYLNFRNNNNNNLPPQPSRRKWRNWWNTTIRRKKASVHPI